MWLQAVTSLSSLKDIIDMLQLVCFLPSRVSFFLPFHQVYSHFELIVLNYKCCSYKCIFILLASKKLLYLSFRAMYSESAITGWLKQQKCKSSLYILKNWDKHQRYYRIKLFVFYMTDPGLICSMYSLLNLKGKIPKHRAREKSLEYSWCGPKTKRRYLRCW